MTIHRLNAYRFGRLVLFLMMPACTLVLAVAQKKGDLPPWAYHSPIAGKKRVEDVKHLEALLIEKADQKNGFRDAVKLFDRTGAVVEPLGEDSSGSSAFRFLTVAKQASKHWFGIMPEYAPDAKATRMIREFLRAKGDPAVGIDPDSPIVYVKMDSKHLQRDLKDVAEAIEELAGKG